MLANLGTHYHMISVGVEDYRGSCLNDVHYDYKVDHLEDNLVALESSLTKYHDTFRIHSKARYIFHWGTPIIRSWRLAYSNISKYV